MTSFSKKAKAEAAKYQHQIHPKARHKYTFNCGAGKQGSKGFQPGNTCGGDGDGKDDAGDQGGGDSSSMWDNLDRFSDQEIGRMVADNAPELEKDDLEKLVAEGKKRGLIRDEVTAENILEQPGFADDAPAAGDYETRRQEIDDKEDSGEISSQDAAGLRDDLDAETGQGQYAPAEGDQGGDDLKKQLAENEAQIAELRQQIAEQKAAGDAEIAEAYKDVTEEDIQDMLEEKDITAAEAEEMRGWVAQAQAAAKEEEEQDAERQKAKEADAAAHAEQDAGLTDKMIALGDAYESNDVEGMVEAYESMPDYAQDTINPEIIEKMRSVEPDAPAADDAGDSEFGPDDVLPRASEEAGLRQDQEYIDSLAEEDYLADLSESELEEVLGPGASAPEAQVGGEARTKPKIPRRKSTKTPEGTMPRPQNLMHNDARDVLDAKGDSTNRFDTPEEAREYLQNEFDYTDEQLDWLQYGQYDRDPPEIEAQAGRPKYYSDTQIWDVLEDIDSKDVYGGQTILQRSLGSSLHEYANPDGSISSADVQNVLDKARRTLSLQIAPAHQSPGMYDKMQELMKLYTEMHPAAPEAQEGGRPESKIDEADERAALLLDEIPTRGITRGDKFNDHVKQARNLLNQNLESLEKELEKVDKQEIASSKVEDRLRESREELITELEGVNNNFELRKMVNLINVKYKNMSRFIDRLGAAEPEAQG